MKKLIYILAFLLPMALTGQSETNKTIVPKKKNALTASTFLGYSSGLAIDYRRGFGKSSEFILGAETTYGGVRGFNVGFRKYYATQKKFSVGFGLDAGLKERNIIGDNRLSRALEKTLLKVDFGEITVVGGAYYKLATKLDLMAEIQMKPLAYRNLGNSRRLKVGLKYNF